MILSMDWSKGLLAPTISDGATVMVSGNAMSADKEAQTNTITPALHVLHKQKLMTILESCMYGVEQTLFYIAEMQHL